jgi:UPF0716 protein FxsA
MRYFGFAVIALALLEVISIVLMSNAIGGFATILLMVLPFFLGSWMLRNVGLSGIFLAGSVLRNNSEGLSLYQMLWPMRYVFAAVLLLSPGFASDIVAAILMLPFKGGKKINTSGGFNADNNTDFMGRKRKSNPADDIIEGEFTVSDDTYQAHKKDHNQKYLDR